MASLQPIYGALGRVLRGIAGKPELYKFGSGAARGAPVEEIAARYGLEAVESASPTGGAIRRVKFEVPGTDSSGSIALYDPDEWSRQVGSEYNKDFNSVLDVVNRVGKPVTDIDTLDARGAGSQLYRALYDTNRQMGALNAVGFLTKTNRQGRRAENMLSDYMRNPDAWVSILPDESMGMTAKGADGVLGKIGPHSFLDIDPDESLGILGANAVASTGRVLGDSIPLVNPRALSTANLNAADVSKQGILQRYGATLNPKNAKVNGVPVGESTLRRAMTIGGIQKSLAGGADEESIIDGILNSGHDWWNKMFYCDGGSVA